MGGWAKASTLVAVIVLRYQLIQLEIRMKKFALASALVLTLVSSYAQPTRPEVKAEAASANKSGTTVRGESSGSVAATPSTKARAEVKGEAAAANKSGDTVKGESSNTKVEKKSKMTAEEKAAARAKRKADAASAVKSGATVRGESQGK
jgi:hypothetical protein